MNSKKVEPKKIVVEEDDLKALSETVVSIQFINKYRKRSLNRVFDQY
jgi:hypothetical protein